MKRRITLVIMFGFLNILLVGVTYSFFVSEASFFANQDIAKFVFNAEETNTISVPITDLNPGDSASYSFEVANNVDDVVSQVSINYQCIIKTYHLMPLEIKLFKTGTVEELILTCDETFSRDSDNQLVCNSLVQKMAYDNKVSDSYRLDISFPEEYNSEIYSELVDYIDIDIRSWQVIGE
jgi:hypothetical protein